MGAGAGPAVCGGAKPSSALGLICLFVLLQSLQYFVVVVLDIVVGFAYLH